MRTKVWAWSLALVASVHVTSASADEGPAGGEQVASRFPVGNPTTETLDAVDGLRTRLGALDGLPLEFRTQSAAELPGVVEAAYGPEGNVIGLWAYREGGLGATVSGQDYDATVRRFISENEGIWHLSGNAAHADGLPIRLVNLKVTPSPRGRMVATLEYRQFRGDFDVLDGTVTAVFWDGVLASVSGPLAAPNLQLYPSSQLDVEISPADAAQAVAERFAESRAGGVDVELTSVGILHRYGIVYRGMAYPDALSSDVRLAEENSPLAVTVDARTGEVIQMESVAQHYASQSASYKVYKPANNRATPDHQDQATVTGHVSVNGTEVYPWVDVLASRSPVPTYHENYNWSGDMGFPWHSNSSGYDFVSSPGTNSFETQHSSYWVQKAIHTANINFTWWPPSDSSYKYSKVSVVSSCSSSARYEPNGWPTATMWRASDGNANQTPRVGVICAGDTSGAYGDGTAARINMLFHEAGHAVDSKYLTGHTRYENAVTGACDPGTSEEGKSLAENIASCYAQLMFAQEWGIATTFTDYDASSIGGVPNLSYVSHANSDSALTVHMGDATVLCYADPGADPCDGANANYKYHYGYPLIQAYWETIHGRNCDPGGPCTVFNDGAGVDESRWAFFYAMEHTSQSDTYLNFVADLLNYYYYDVGSTPWGNRWWVFNHHRLIGPNYGYSPCHSY